MSTCKALSLAVATVALGCGTDLEAPTPPAQSEIAALCGPERTESVLPLPTSARDGRGESRWFTIGALSLGFDDLRTAKPSSDAWKCYGFDLDGRSTSLAQSKGGSGTCKRVSGAKSDALVDGVSGIDNNFGRFMLPLLHGFDGCLADPARQEGSFKVLLRIDGDPTTDASHVVGALYVGRPGIEPPVGIHPASLAPLQPVAVFPDGYVANGFWVSGAAADARMDLPLMVGFRIWPEDPLVDGCPASAELRIPIAEVVLTIKMDDGAGMLGGAIPIASLRSSLATWLGSSGLCPGSSLSQTVIDTITPYADIATASRPDPGVTCDAISLGIGFRLSPIASPPALTPLAALDTTACVAP